MTIGRLTELRVVNLNVDPVIDLQHDYEYQVNSVGEYDMKLKRWIQYESLEMTWER